MGHNWIKKSPLIISCLFFISLLIICKVLERVELWKQTLNPGSDTCQPVWVRIWFLLTVFEPRILLHSAALGKVKGCGVFPGVSVDHSMAQKMWFLFPLLLDSCLHSTLQVCKALSYHLCFLNLDFFCAKKAAISIFRFCNLRNCWSSRTSWKWLKASDPGLPAVSHPGPYRVTQPCVMISGPQWGGEDF